METRRESLRGLKFDDLRNRCTTTTHPGLIALNRNSPRTQTSSPATYDSIKPSEVPCTGQQLIHNFDFDCSAAMVLEEEATQNPLHPFQAKTTQPVPVRAKPMTSIPGNMQNKNTMSWPGASPQPEFGRPTVLGSAGENRRIQETSSASLAGVRRHDEKNANSFDHLFAKSRPRAPEFHKPPGSTNPLQQIGKLKTDQNPIQIRPADSTSRPKVEKVNPDSEMDMFFRQPSLTKQLSKINNNDVTIISKPSNFPTQQFRAPMRPVFSSNLNTNPYYQTKSDFVDLTLDKFRSANDDGFDDRQVFGNERFGSSDPYMYLDYEQANENIKALLEGALDAEDDKPRTRKKKRKEKADSKVNDLTAKLQQVEIRSEIKEQDAPPEEEEEEEDDDGTREGLKVKLLPHQIEGLEWMLNKELGTKKVKGILPKGGILADDMGLGKTIQAIALILSNRRPATEELNKSKQKSDTKIDKATLVVAPLALIKQWEAEIRDRVEPDHALQVRVHHGPQRTKSYKDLGKYDVVITTYQTLSSEHAEGSEKLKTALFGVDWFRVILDEAHSIKNRNAKTTKAACALNSEHRWCLTGTPMQNNLDELQSLIHFLRIKPYDNLAVWREQITKPMNSGRGGLSIRRLRAFLSAFMKRRTKDILKQDGFGDGKGQQSKPDKGFHIVNRTVIDVEAEFSEQERSFYQGLEARTDRSLELMMAGNKLSYANALVLLMRLRQACNHPKLLGTDLAKEHDPGTRTPGRKGSKADDMDEIANMLGELSVQMKRCDICQIELGKDAVNAGHLRCDDCERDLKQHSIPKQKSKKKAMNQVRRVNRKVIFDSDEDEEEEKSKGHAAREEKQELSEVEEDSEYDSEDSVANEPDFASSTKIRYLIKILQQDSHNHKYIVFSFFTSMLNLIEPFMRKHHIKFVRYDGAMRNDMREASLESLRNDPTVRVLLCSLRAGSLGLNLTAASRVVILEPFWNPFVEEQAIDRVHRLNQTQDVIVHKLTIKDTVEARILNLQERKRELANATIEGHKGAGAAKLSLQEMLRLFRHDYGHDAKLDMIGMKDGRSLMERGESTGPSLTSGNGKGIGQTKKSVRAEDPIYGRRW